MKKVLKLTGWTLALLFLSLNLVAALHAWKFTHFTPGGGPKPSAGHHYSLGQKLGMALTGVNNPRPETGAPPTVPNRAITLQSHRRLSAWYIPAEGRSTGSVAIFHGYGGEKASMLDKAMVFRRLGYHTLLVDMQGAGGSEGNQCTIGYREAEDVEAAFRWLSAHSRQPVYLMGTSMGAAAILRAVAVHHIEPQAILIECPFGSLYKTVSTRFAMQGLPVFPMAGLLVFWGGALNGFWAFDHSPEEYARAVHCPTLLMYGARDSKVSRAETDAIYEHLPGRKQLVIFPEAGHENYLRRYGPEWEKWVGLFLAKHGPAGKYATHQRDFPVHSDAPKQRQTPNFRPLFK